MTNTNITRVDARQVYDSRGVATIEVEVEAAGRVARTAAPFGAPGSRGEYEASAYGVDGVDGALNAVRTEIGPQLVGLEVDDLQQCDGLLRQIDGTANFDRIGGNTSSAVSTTVAVLAAKVLDKPLYALFADDVTLPRPLGNIIGGGAHAMGPTPDMQEHLALPINAESFAQAVEWNILVHEETGRLLLERDPNFAGGSDDERAWAANLDDTEALDVVHQATQTVSASTGAIFRLGIDAAADRMWDPAKGRYVYHRTGLELTPAEQVDFIEALVRRFNLGYVEDAFESNDYDSFAELNRRVGDDCLVCGDDLLATNVARTTHGLDRSSVNAMIIKVNQVGTVTGARETTAFAAANGLAPAISHRSGETDDSSIAHFGAAWGCALIKAGVTGGERLAKLNELIRIEQQAGATFAPLPQALAR